MLHNAGVGAFDLSPQHIYVDASLNRCVLLPSPWLAKTADKTPDGVLKPFVAPEVGRGNADFDPVKADIYAIGALVWYLLTGEPRTGSVSLPSEVRPSLAAWDELIDGCCRNHPARRFSSIASLIAALPVRAYTPDDRSYSRNSGAATKIQPKRPGRGRLIVFGSTAVIVLAAIVWLFTQFGGGLTGSGSVRGFAGSVVRYAERDYEGASWQKLYAAANLGNLPYVGMKTAKLRRITGVDENNLWIVDDKGIVFRLADGHWGVAANQPDAWHPMVGLIDNETLLISGYGSRKQIHLVGPDGVRTIASEDLTTLWPTDLVIPVAPGLSYITTSTYRKTYKLVEGKLTRTSPGAQKDSVVVDEYAAPVNINPDYPITPARFAYSAALSPGEVYAIWMLSTNMRMVEYRDGAWVMIDQITIPRSEINTLTAAWISKDDEGKVFVVFGAAGAAILYRQGEGVRSYPINAATAGTRIKLIRVWGTGPENFWVMDESGSVWERNNNRWRPAIRGLLDEKIKLNDAWVSDTGVVFAVSDDALYRLN